jgi:uncharacterized membrane-anchored protein
MIGLNGNLLQYTFICLKIITLLTECKNKSFSMYLIEYIIYHIKNDQNKATKSVFYILNTRNILP